MLFEGESWLAVGVMMCTILSACDEDYTLFLCFYRSPRIAKLSKDSSTSDGTYLALVCCIMPTVAMFVGLTRSR